MSGSDLMTGSQKIRVDADFLESAALLPFSGIVADDGLSITIHWAGSFCQYEEDSQGDLLYCNQTNTEENSFTTTRITSGN